MERMEGPSLRPATYTGWQGGSPKRERSRGGWTSERNWQQGHAIQEGRPWMRRETRQRDVAAVEQTPPLGLFKPGLHTAPGKHTGRTSLAQTPVGS